MRLVLLIAVIALLVDVFLFGAAYTQGAYAQLKYAADQVVSLIGDVVGFGPHQEGARHPTLWRPA